MKEKINIFLLGSLVSVSLISPPGFLRLSFIEFSDFLILIFSLILFIDFIRKNNTFDLTDNVTRFWGSLTLLLILSLFLYGVNFFTLRLIFYCITGFLFTVFVEKKTTNELQYFLFPFIFVSILNFASSLFQLSFVDNTIGWITYYFENPTFFNRGRLSGFQGSGPNVAGGMFTILSFICLYFYNELKSKLFLLLTFLNLYLVFISYSRGSWLSLFLGLFIYIYLKKRNLKQLVYALIFIFLGTLGFLNIFNSEILLKESDRGFLTKIAFDNLNILRGLGPGNYVDNIYKDYFLSINPEILEQNLNINLNKVELGITPIEHRDSNVEFYIGTSGGGYEILVQSRLVSECSEDRITCQHVRVKKDLFSDFFAAIYTIDSKEIASFMEESGCFDDSNLNILRGETYCFLNYIYDNIIDNQIPKNLTYVPCTDTSGYQCKSRELAVGELAVMVEQLSIRNEFVPFDNYKIFCEECNFRNVEGFIKLKFDKRDTILPRSIISFYTSKDGDNWDMVGYERTSGAIINLNKNSAYIEIGGHSDGQSFGNTFLDSTVKEVNIISNNISKNVIFTKNNLNKDYYVFKPNQVNDYTANITYENNGIKLFRPNKYWVAIDNNLDFSEDFEIVLHVSFPEIPQRRQTLISNTSIINGQVQSWKLETDDGRLFFSWADNEGVFLDTNNIGDKSLRSGVLIQQNGQLSNTNPPIVDPSFLSQLTTAHNGYLTFSVEFGLMFSILFYLIIAFGMFKALSFINSSNIFPYLAMMMFLIQNITNDMIYSPDMFVLFILSAGIFIQSTKSFEDKKS